MTTISTSVLTPDALLALFSPLKQWEERYRQLILLGKKLPVLTDEEKATLQEVNGCENRVWIGYQLTSQGKYHFYGDSDGRIVRGLLMVLLSAINNKSASDLLKEDPLLLFQQLGLQQQLSASRTAGVEALIQHIRHIASMACSNSEDESRH